MAEWIRKLSPKAAELWEKLSPGRRMAFLAGIALLVGSLVLIASTVQTGSYTPLFSNLDSRDAGEIIQTLKEDNIPYRIGDNGTTILVPEDIVYETRLQLASAGMPRGGTVGFELFNQSSLGTTDFERRLKYNWALQGELTRTIREMREVDDARVHIVIPEDSLFVEEQEAATASVLLKLRPYAQLSEGQVRGIANLVAYSVEGLKPQNVTILDSNGNILSDSIRLDSSLPISGEIVTAQLKMKETTEQRLEESVKTMLDRVFGYGSAVVRVNTELNFEYKESEAEKYSPVVDDTGLVRSEQEYLEEYSGSDQGAMGVPGISSNIPTYETEGETGESSQFTKRDVTRNYELNRLNERVITPPGSINRLTVAVWLDGEIPQEQLAQVRAAVESAVGFSSERGDQVTIESMTFERPEAEAFEEPVPDSTEVNVVTYLPYAIAIGMAIGGVVLLTRRKKSQSKKTEADLNELIEGAHREHQSAEESEAKKLERELRDYAAQKPADAAKLLKTWLTEDES